MFIRISLGMLSFVVVSVFFGQPFNIWSLVLSILFILLPLVDWLPYLMIRKKYKLVSHYLWYYPLVYVPVGAVIVWIILKGEYYVILFIMNSLANFIHATFRTPLGLEWFWPFSKNSFSLYGNELTIFSKDERLACMKKKYAQYEARSLKKRGKQEARSLSEEFSDRKHPKGKKTVALLAISILAVMVFWLLN
ncbi:MAG: hypothetical protein WAV73_04605 [Candidatus Moraniibacteriota bacterium]